MTITPYQPLEVVEVIDTGDKGGPHVYYVRDDDNAQFWCRVEYMHRRLICWCDDGIARHEDQYEPECRHLVAVLGWRALSLNPPLPPLGVIDASLFVD